MRSIALLWTIAAATCLLTQGCDTRTADKTVPPQEVLQAAPSGTPFRIIASDAGFEMPDTLPAGLRHIVFENRGSKIEEALLIKLPKGMSGTDYVAAVKGGALFPEGGLDYSGPGLTSPGEVVELWLPVDPGEYIVFCWNRDHAHAHSLRSFTVKDQSKANDVPPREDVVLKMVDFRFELSQPLRKGVQVVRVEPIGPSMHEVDFWRLHEGRTVADVQAWYKQKDEAPAPAQALGGVLDSHVLGQTVWLKREFAPGRYVLHCVMPMSMEAKAGSSYATHADAGMVSEFEIKN